jgi:F-type H+-transporting ATPase subunit b
MVDINWTVFPQMINFIVLIFILNMVLYKPIRKILKERKNKVEGLSQGIESASRQAEEKDRAFDQGLRDARTRGQKEKEAMIQTAAREEREIVGRIMDQARADLDVVKSKIAKDVDAVKVALERDVDTFADAITQKILGRTA